MQTTPKSRRLIEALHAAPFHEYAEIMRRFDLESAEEDFAVVSWV